MNNYTSLCEVNYGIAAHGNKLTHLGLTYTPTRSTFSEANAWQTKGYFGEVNGKLHRHYQGTLADSPIEKELLKRIFIIHSTTISLFKAIIKYVGR